MNLPSLVDAFLQQHCDFSRPLLIGLSGGPDSLCLFHLLLSLKEKHSLKIHIAHINHRWREESDQEAALLQSLAGQHSLPFHLKVLDPSLPQGNLENAARQERLSFFSSLCHQYDCQAVLLGHHADDQGETVLKRLLEGGSMLRLSALQKKSQIDALPLWRPLLDVPKSALIDWLTHRGITFFTDSTNVNSQFLRGRLRSRILPFLNKEFGKNVNASLCHLAKEMTEVRHYLDDKISPYLKMITQSKRGLYLNLQETRPATTLELKVLIKKFCEEGHFSLPYSREEEVVEMVLSGVADRKILSGKQCLFIDRKRLFLPTLSTESSLPHSFQLLTEGTTHYGPWTVKVVEAPLPHDTKPAIGWEHVWAGCCSIALPLSTEAPLYLAPPKPSASYINRSQTLDKWWTDHKVPAFLREEIPAIWQDQSIYYEFLSGKPPHQEWNNRKKWVTLFLTHLTLIL